MKNKKDNIEDIFKDSFENFEADVNPGTWKNIQTGLKGAGLGVLVKALFNKIGSTTLVAVVSSAATVVGTVLVMNWIAKDDKAQSGTENIPAKTVVEKPSVNEIKDFLSTDTGNAQKQAAAPSESVVAVNEQGSKTESPNIIKKDKQQIEEAIKSLSDASVAVISPSVVGGSVPLILSVSNLGSGKLNKWDFGDGKKESGANPIHVYDVPGIYKVTLTSTSADGKVATDSVKIEVFGNSSVSTSSEADFFTPNGDGDRDEFVFNTKHIQKMRVVIANEKSEIVYSIFMENEEVGKWDGRNLKGKPVKEGIYYYVVNAEGKDGKKIVKKGKINLTR